MSGTFAAPPSPNASLDARPGDATAPSLALAARWVGLATPALRARSELVFLSDASSGAARAAAVVIRQGERILDAATGKSHESLSDYLRDSPQYRVAGTVSASAAARVFAAPVGSPPRAEGIALAKVTPEVGRLLAGEAVAAPAYGPEQAARDAQILREAIAGRGTDEDAILRTLEGRTMVEVTQIADAYFGLCGGNLRQELIDETSGAMRERVIERMYGDEPAYVAATLRDELEDVFVDEEAVLATLEAATPEVRARLEELYKRRYADGLMLRLEEVMDPTQLARARALLRPSAGVDLPDPPADQTWKEWWKGQTPGLIEPPGSVFVDGPSPADVVQGSTGDCYLLSSLASLAASDPDAIRNMVRDNLDGTYTVSFYTRGTLGLITGALEKVEVTVDGDFYSYGNKPTYAGSPGGEQWVQLVEKAYAQHWGGYDDIGSGGLLTTGLSAVTGKPASSIMFFDPDAWVSLHSPDAVWAQIQKSIDARSLVTAGTYPSGGEDLGLVPRHAYSVLGYREVDGERWVELRNPWGHGEPGEDGANDGRFLLPFDDFMKHFSELAYLD